MPPGGTDGAGSRRVTYTDRQSVGNQQPETMVKCDGTRWGCILFFSFHKSMLCWSVVYVNNRLLVEYTMACHLPILMYRYAGSVSIIGVLL